MTESTVVVDNYSFRETIHRLRQVYAVEGGWFRPLIDHRINIKLRSHFYSDVNESHLVMFNF